MSFIPLLIQYRLMCRGSILESRFLILILGDTALFLSFGILVWCRVEELLKGLSRQAPR